MTGKIAIVEFGECSIDKHIQMVKNAGGIGVLLIANNAWKVCNLKDMHSHKETLPTLCVFEHSPSLKNFLTQFKENESENKETLLLFSAGKNPFDSLNKGAMEFKRVWMLLVSSVLMILSSFKLFQLFSSCERKYFGITVISLSLICNILFLFFFNF